MAYMKYSQRGSGGYLESKSSSPVSVADLEASMPSSIEFKSSNKPYNQNENNEEALDMKDDKGEKKDDDDADDYLTWYLMSSLENKDLKEQHAIISETAAQQDAKLKAFLDSKGLFGYEAQLRDFGIDSIRDLEDSHLVNDQTLAGDMGFTQAQVAHITAVLNHAV
mmetsp:Transcript_83160/g.166388  ORF Transcript_83160/g.166388 Transcript_83160/m.166388 type:complete len:166 (+) Transcript_83160:402-899(+)